MENGEGQRETLSTNLSDIMGLLYIYMYIFRRGLCQDMGSAKSVVELRDKYIPLVKF